MELLISVFEEDGIWNAYSPSLDVSAYGETMEEAVKSFNVSLDLFVEDFEGRLIELNAYLKSLGWRKNRYFNKVEVEEEKLVSVLIEKGIPHDNLVPQEFALAY